MPQLVSVGRFRRRKAAVKLHTLLELHGNIPTFLRVTIGTQPEVEAFFTALRQIVPSQPAATAA